MVTIIQCEHIGKISGKHFCFQCLNVSFSCVEGRGLAVYHVVSSKVLFQHFPCSSFIGQYSKIQLCVLFCRSVNTEADGVAELLLPLEIQIISSSIWRGKLKKKIQTKETKNQRQNNPQMCEKTSKTQTPTTLKCVCLHAHTFLHFQYQFLYSQIFLPVSIALCLLAASGFAVTCILCSS